MQVKKLTEFLKVIASSFLYYSGISRAGLRILLTIRPANFIFMYHRITDNNNGLFRGVSKPIFKKQIEFLKKYFKFITLNELINLKSNSKGSFAVITFDDGYKSVFTKAFPILERNRIPATIFVATGAVDNNTLIWTDKINLLKLIGKDDDVLEDIKNYYKKLPDRIKDMQLDNLIAQSDIDCNSIPEEEKMLSWEEINYLSKNGVELGAHTVNHPILTKISTSEAKKEIVDSKGRIESITGKQVNSFCYPNGTKKDFDENIKQILKNNGLKCAVTVEEGSVSTADDFFALKRVSLGNRSPCLAVLKVIKELMKNV